MIEREHLEETIDKINEKKEFYQFHIRLKNLKSVIIKLVDEIKKDKNFYYSLYLIFKIYERVIGHEKIK